MQGYVECDYKKSNSRNVAHLRIDAKSIKAPYKIEQADFVSCQHIHFITNDNAIAILKPNGILLVTTQLTSKAFWQTLSAIKQEEIKSKNIQVFVIDNEWLKEEYTVNGYKLNSLYAAFLSLKNDIVYTDEIADLRDSIYKVDTTIAKKDFIENDNEFSNTLLGKLLRNKGNEVLVSELPVDGTYPTNTSKYNHVVLSNELPVWNPDACTQCGACSMACPQSTIRMKVHGDSYVETVPENFKSTKSVEADFDLLNFTLQVNPDQCTGCNNCVDACPVKGALQLVEKQKNL